MNVYDESELKPDEVIVEPKIKEWNYGTYNGSA